MITEVGLLLALSALVGFVGGISAVYSALRRRYFCAQCGDYAYHAFCPKCASPDQPADRALAQALVDVKTAERVGRDAYEKAATFQRERDALREQAQEVDCVLADVYDKLRPRDPGAGPCPFNGLALAREVLAEVSGSRDAVVPRVQQFSTNAHAQKIPSVVAKDVRVGPLLFDVEIRYRVEEPGRWARVSLEERRRGGAFTFTVKAAHEEES